MYAYHKIICAQHLLGSVRLSPHVSVCSSCSVFTSSVLQLLEFSLSSKVLSLSYRSKAAPNQLQHLSLQQSHL